MPITWPVMYPVSRRARNSTRSATSSTVPNRPAGMTLSYSFRRSSGKNAVISVSIKPGAMALTVIWREASSRRIDSGSVSGATGTDNHDFMHAG